MTALTQDVSLAALRIRADELLDPIVRELARRPGAVAEMLGLLFASASTDYEHAGLEQLFSALPDVAVEEPEHVATGQGLFALYGPEILLILGCYALPSAYAAADGVRVIHRARRLTDDAKRRLCETAQFVINVMKPGGLSSAQIGCRSTHKVRVMHALVREHVRQLPGGWPDSSVPINQEELLGTLLTFSVLVLNGLARMGATLSEAEQSGYLALWRHIGVLLGIEPSAIPRTIDAARELAIRIGQRQVRPCAEGRQLTRQLIDAVDALFPLPGYGLSLMHFFLDESLFGVNVAAVLDLPPANWTRVLVRGRAAHKKLVLHWLERVPGARRRRALFSGHFAQRLILWQRPDERVPFEAPGGIRR